MKFEFNWANGFGKLCFNILMGLQYERPKVDLDLAIVSLG